jgi:hypothetical protein
MTFDQFPFSMTSIRQYHAIMAISALKPTRIQLPWPDPPTLLPLVVKIIHFGPGSDGAPRPLKRPSQPRQRIVQEAAITPGLHQLTSARRTAPSPPPNRRCTKIVGMPSSLVIAIGGDHHHRQIGEAMFDLAQQLKPSMPCMLMPERMTISCGSISPASRSSAASP